MLASSVNYYCKSSFLIHKNRILTNIVGRARAPNPDCLISNISFSTFFSCLLLNYFPLCFHFILRPNPDSHCTTKMRQQRLWTSLHFLIHGISLINSHCFLLFCFCFLAFLFRLFGTFTQAKINKSHCYFLL